MKPTTEFQWGRLLLSAAKLGIRPAEFWQLSLREWQMLMRVRSGSGFSAKDLGRLIEAYPDKE